MPFKQVVTRMARCLRCGHVWRPRVRNPKQCSSCRDRRWDEKRIYKVKKGGAKGKKKSKKKGPK